LLDAFLGIAGTDPNEKRPERPVLWPTEMPY
jgi:hypothetical protein